MRLLLALPLLFAPCMVQAQQIDPKVNEAFARYAALPARLIPILESVKDKESADATAPRLLEALPAVYDARSGLHGIANLDAQQTRLVQQKYEAVLRRDWGKLFEQIYRLQKVACYESVPFFKQFQTLCLMLEK